MAATGSIEVHQAGLRWRRRWRQRLRVSYLEDSQDL